MVFGRITGRWREINWALQSRLPAACLFSCDCAPAFDLVGLVLRIRERVKPPRLTVSSRSLAVRMNVIVFERISVMAEACALLSGPLLMAVGL